MVSRIYPDLLKFSNGSTNGKPNCPWYVGRKDERIRKCARDCIQIHPNDPVEQGNCQKDKRLCFKVALLHKDLKCKAPLIEPNLRRNLGKWST